MFWNVLFDLLLSAIVYRLGYYVAKDKLSKKTLLVLSLLHGLIAWPLWIYGSGVWRFSMPLLLAAVGGWTIERYCLGTLTLARLQKRWIIHSVGIVLIAVLTNLYGASWLVIPYIALGLGTTVITTTLLDKSANPKIETVLGQVYWLIIPPYSIYVVLAALTNRQLRSPDDLVGIALATGVVTLASWWWAISECETKTMKISVSLVNAIMRTLLGLSFAWPFLVKGHLGMTVLSYLGWQDHADTVALSFDQFFKVFTFPLVLAGLWAPYLLDIKQKSVGP